MSFEVNHINTRAGLTSSKANDRLVNHGSGLFITNNRPVLNAVNKKNNDNSLILDNRKTNNIANGGLIQLKKPGDIIQLGRNPYGRDVEPLSLENVLIFLYELLDFISIGLLEDLTRLFYVHRAHQSSGDINGYTRRIIFGWMRFIGRVLTRSAIGYILLRLFPHDILGLYLSMLIANVLNWFYENLIVRLGEYAYHEGSGTTRAAITLSYLRYIEGVEPESVDYPVVRRSGRRTGDTGRAIGIAEGVPGNRLSAQEASGGVWHNLSRFFRNEWGHRQADSHRGANTAANLGSESLGANSQEMVSERAALELSRANPGQIRRRNFGLRIVGTLVDRIRRNTIFINGNPLLTETVRSDRGPMTTYERSAHEDDYANQRSVIVAFNLRNALIVPLLGLVIALLIRFLS